jgi:hypothetical protein
VAVPSIPLAAVQGAKGAYLSIGRRGGTDMSIEAMKLMVHELEYVLDCINKDKIPFDGDDFHEALRLGRQAIEQAEKQEPVAWMCSDESLLHKGYSRFSRNCEGAWNIPVYTTPQPQREWVGLTQQDIDIAFDDTQEGGGFNEFARAIEQTLRRKNT